MFQIVTQYRYKKVQELDNVGKPWCTIRFQSDTTDFVPFKKQFNFQTEPVNDVVGFGDGKYAFINVSRDNWTDLETAVNAIVDNVKTKLSNGVDAINLELKPSDTSENSVDGKVWST